MELLVSNIQNEKFAFYLDNIQEVIEKRTIETLPNSPEFLEGIFNYRKNVIPVFGLRRLMNMKSFHQEQCETLENIKKVHNNWLDSLNSITESEQLKSFSYENGALVSWMEENLKCMKCNNLGFVNIIKNNLTEPYSKLVQISKGLDYQDKERLEELYALHKRVLDALDVLEKEIDLLSNAFQKIVIYKIGSSIFGLVIDDIDRIVNVEKESFKSAEVITKSPFLSANSIVEVEDRIVLILEFNEEVLDEFDSFRSKESVEA